MFGKGSKHTIESRLLMSKRGKENPTKFWLGKKRGPLSESWKNKISAGNKGKKKPPFSESHKRNIGLSHIGLAAWNKGKKGEYHFSGKALENVRRANAKRDLHPPHFSREKHWNWKGGVFYQSNLACRLMPEYKLWRSSVLERDNWTCQTCGIRGVRIVVHHIKGFSEIIRENNIRNVKDAETCMELWDVSNGVSLCMPCHALTENFCGRGKKK